MFGLDKKFLVAMSAFLAALSVSALDYSTLWELDIGDSSYGYVNSSNLATSGDGLTVGTELNTTNGLGNAELYWPNVGTVFEWGKTIIKVSGTLQFESSPGGWFGFSFSQNSNVDMAYNGYGFLFFTGSGNVKAFLDDSKTETWLVSDVAIKDKIETGNTFSFEVTYDSTQSDTALVATLNIYDADGNAVLNDPKVFQYVNEGLNTETFDNILTSFRASETETCNGWLESFKVEAAVIPEPAALSALFGVVALFLAVYRRRL